MQVDAGGLPMRVSKQDLNGRQVSTVLQMVRSETVTKHMRRNAFLEASVAGGFSADIPDGLVGEVLVTALFDPGGKKPGLWFLPAPVFTERFQQLRTHRYVAIFAALALANVNDHALAVYVLHAKPDQFTASNAGRVKQHENSARLEIACGINQLGYLLCTQDPRNAVMGVLGVRNGVGWKPAFQRAHEKESQCRNLPDYRIGLQLPFVQ